MDFKAVVVVFLALYVAQNYGMPANPIFRLFGIQQDNPNVKVFSTYQAYKPNETKDNPNELKKGSKDDEKFLKKEKFSLEDEPMKSDGDAKNPDKDTEIAPETTSGVENAQPSTETVSQNDPQEAVETLSEESSQMTKDESVQLFDTEDGTRKSLTGDEEDMLAAPSSDAVQFEETEMQEEPMERLEPIVDDMLALQSQSEAIIPIAIDAPLNILPPIVDSDDVGEFIFDSLGNVEVVDEPSHSFSVGPSMIPEETADEEQKVTESTSAVLEDQLGKKTMLKPTSEDAVEPMKTIAESQEERIEPMASLTESNGPVGPIVEIEPDMSTANLPEIDMSETVTEEIATEEPLPENENIEGIGEIGASMPISNSDIITPIVEAEPAAMFTTGKVEEMPIEAEAEKERVSLKIINENEKLEPFVFESAETAVQGEEDVQTEEPMPMAGFMSDASKSMATEADNVATNHAVPSTTELTYVLSIDDAEITTEKYDIANAEDTKAETTQEVIENSPEGIVNSPESASELSTLSTTPAVPIVDPIELTLQEEQVSGNDPSINETF